MSKTIIVTRGFVLFALMLIGVASASASEVTGTLSSGIGGNNSGGNSETSGTLSSAVDSNTIGGTVVSGNSSGSGGGGRSSGGNRGTGQVLGLSTTNTNTPAFPNTGYDPGSGPDDDEDYDIWGTLMVLAVVGSLFTLTAIRLQRKVV